MDRLRVQAIKAKIEASQLYCDSLAAQFQATPSSAQRTEIAERYDAALAQTHAMQLLLELLERDQREGHGEDSIRL